MRINEKHPSFLEFYKKWQLIANEMNEKIKETEEQERKRGFRGLDGKSDEIRKEYSKKLKKLQEDYSFLYNEEK